MVVGYLMVVGHLLLGAGLTRIRNVGFTAYPCKILDIFVMCGII